MEEKAITAKARKLLEARDRIAAKPPRRADISFQHTVLCQTSLPHRPTTARVWEREQGNVSLLLEAGRVRDGPRWIEVPLPHGEKPRLLLIHFNGEAASTGSPVIDMQRSLTAFVRSLGIDPKGAQIGDLKRQMTRLAVANIRFAVGEGPGLIQGQMRIVQAGKFDLWWPKDERQRVLWPTVLRLSDEYFAALDNHAVPLDRRAIAVLKGSSLCLDIYCWLAQRLHRIPVGRPQHVPWAALKEQFGPDYGRMVDFRARFREALGEVLAVYRDAKIELADDGLILFHSQPPVPKRLVNGGILSVMK